MGGYSPTTDFEESDDYTNGGSPIVNDPPASHSSAPVANVAPAAPAQKPQKTPDWDKFGMAIQQAVKDFRGDTPNAEGGLPFGNQMSLPRVQPAMSNQAAPVELNPLSVALPMQRPGEQAIQALARLYPGFSL